ncbi:MAG: hypothetical protein ACE5OR_17310 [bacterium]
MEYQNAREDIRLILSWFSDVFSRPSFRIFCSFIVGFIQLGKETHTASMVQSLSRCSIWRSLSSFTRFLGKNTWTQDRLVEIALGRFFKTLRIKARCVVFLIIDDTIAKKSGKKIPGCSWHEDHAQNVANVFGHQWIFRPCFTETFSCPFGLGSITTRASRDAVGSTPE